MKRKLFFLTVLFLFSAALSYCADGGDWKNWYTGFLKSLKTRVEKSMRPRSRITAVAAVRGAKQKDKSSQVYWKGSTSQKAQEKIDQDRKVIQEAVENIVNGDVEKGRAQLKDFVNKNPDSYFISEAREALEKLPSVSGKPPVVKPEGEKEPTSKKEEVKEEKPQVP